MPATLQFRGATGESLTAEVQIDEAEFPAGRYLMARKVWLDDGTELRQHRVVPGPQREFGYDHLDNEILAGRRLHGVTGRSGSPPEVTALYGDEDSSADPFTLIEPYRGVPIREAGPRLLGAEQDAFEVSLLTGLCWLAAAGLAHRALNPDTVLWDDQRGQVQITDFSESTVFGAAREPAGSSPEWVPREQQPGYGRSLVTDRDDIWAAGRLIYFVRNQGESPVDRSQVESGPLGPLLRGVFGPPEGRPTAWEMLVRRLKRPDPLPRGAGSSEWLAGGRRSFWAVRQQKHPEAALPPEAAQYTQLPAGGPAAANGAVPTAASNGSARHEPVSADRPGRDTDRRRLFSRKRETR